MLFPPGVAASFQLASKATRRCTIPQEAFQIGAHYSDLRNLSKLKTCRHKGLLLRQLRQHLGVRVALRILLESLFWLLVPRLLVFGAQFAFRFLVPNQNVSYG